MEKIRSGIIEIIVHAGVLGSIAAAVIVRS